MKTLRKVVLPLLFVALAVAAMLLVVFAQYKEVYGGVTTVIKGVTFGATEQITTIGSTTISTKIEDCKPAIMPLIGFILMGLGLVAGVLAIFIKDEKVAKVVALFAALFVLVGGVFQFFALSSLARAMADKTGGKYEDYMEHAKEAGGKIVLCTVGGILGIVASLVLAARALLPAKK